MTGSLPLSARLAQTLVAFTIECDNEFEHRMPHRTTNHTPAIGARLGPWLVSILMWWNCMRFVSDEGISLSQMEHLARTRTNLDGMRRWGYILLDPQNQIRATLKGRVARAIWQGLPAAIEDRWRERFGASEVERIRESLTDIANRIETNLPDCLPILGYGLFSRAPDTARPEATSDLPLPALLSKVLLQYAIEFERESEVSLAIAANVLRLATTGPETSEAVRVRDLPRFSGVSKEAIATSLSYLEKRGYAATGPDKPGSRVKVLTLTPKGRAAQAVYRALLPAIEERWENRFGRDALLALRGSLEPFTATLFAGLKPYPDGWRAAVPPPETLPHFPMVLHRGGFPDGA